MLTTPPAVKDWERDADLGADDPSRPEARKTRVQRRLRSARPYEADVLAATVAALPVSDAEPLRRQVALVERLQRWNYDRMVIVGFEDRAAVPRLPNEALDHCLARVRLTGEFGSLRASVMTHRGILSSLEFRRSPRKLGGHQWVVEVTTTETADREMSGAIDAEEH